MSTPFYDLASLVVVPSGYKASKVYAQKPLTTDGQLTFSRNTGATRVNSAGLIEKVRTNLALYSEDQTNWTNQNETSVTANAAANPLNGAVTADKVIPSATTDDHYRGLSMGSMIGEISSSIYVKADGYSIIDYGVYNSAAGNYPVRAVFDLSTQAITYINGSIASITSIGSGWYRISVTASVASTGTMSIYHRVRPSGTSGTYAGNGTSGMLLWGCQLESGVTTPYIGPTTTAAVSVGPVDNVPRLDYLNSSCPRLLLEPQRTNLVTYSEQLNNSAAWGSAGITMTANQAVSPDGNTNADLAVNSSSVNYLYQGLGSPFSGTYTVSIFAKKGSKSSFAFGMVAGGFTGGMGVKFNFDTQTFSTPTNYGNFTSMSASYQSYGNGWYRLSLTGTTATSTTYFFVLGSLQESFAVNAYVYGAQCEAGAYATSYIPTLGAAVTRGADAFYKNSISSLIGQSSGVVFADIVPSQFSDGSYIGISDNTAVNRQIFGFEGNSGNSGTLRFYGAFGGSAGTFYVGQRYKIAMAYANNDFVVYVNGTQLFSLSSGTMSGTLSHFGFDSYFAQAQTFEGKVNQALLFKTRLTNAQLAELTTL